MACWPATLGPDEPDEGTVYVAPSRFPALIERWRYAGQAFKVKTHWVCYQPNRKLTYRNAANLRPEGAEDFLHIMDSCKAAGMNPPASFAEPFRHVYRSPALQVSELSALRHHRAGGWEAALIPTPGIYHGEVWWYDLNQAYRWASCVGLPHPTTAVPLERPDYERPSVYLVEGDASHLPWWSARPALRLMTNEEGAALRRPARVLRSVGFTDYSVDLTPVFKQIEESFPYCYKRIGRAFWGIWNTPKGPKRLTWASG